MSGDVDQGERCGCGHIRYSHRILGDQECLAMGRNRIACGCAHFEPPRNATFAEYLLFSDCITRSLTGHRLGVAMVPFWEEVPKGPIVFALELIGPNNKPVRQPLWMPPELKWADAIEVIEDDGTRILECSKCKCTEFEYVENEIVTRHAGKQENGKVHVVWTPTSGCDTGDDTPGLICARCEVCINLPDDWELVHS